MQVVKWVSRPPKPRSSAGHLLRPLLGRPRSVGWPASSVLAASNRRGEGAENEGRGGQSQEEEGAPYNASGKKGGERRNLHFCLIPWVGG